MESMEILFKCTDGRNKPECEENILERELVCTGKLTALQLVNCTNLGSKHFLFGDWKQI